MIHESISPVHGTIHPHVSISHVKKAPDKISHVSISHVIISDIQVSVSPLVGIVHVSVSGGKTVSPVCRAGSIWGSFTITTGA